MNAPTLPHKIPVILDTDIGTDIDDTWALAMLLGCPELDPRLVLTANGDTIYRAHLAARFLQSADRTDIPIGVGIYTPEGTLKFQAPWLDGYDIDSYPGQIHPQGIERMVEIIMNSPEPVSVVSIGITTNIAAALALEPRIASRCRFVGMHGSISLGYDGAPGAVAEANVKYDVPSIRKVLAAPWIETILTPLDTCGLIVLEGERYQQIYHSTKPVMKALMENYAIWADLVNWTKVDYAGQKSSTLFDTVAIYLAYSRDLLNVQPIRLAVTDEGLTVPSEYGEEIQAALSWKSLEAFYDHLVERLNP
jgi:inosine-uridine nucleoside N-ribohydrolase